MLSDLLIAAFIIFRFAFHFLFHASFILSVFFPFVFFAILFVFSPLIPAGFALSSAAICYLGVSRNANSYKNRYEQAKNVFIH